MEELAGLDVWVSFGLDWVRIFGNVRMRRKPTVMIIPFPANESCQYLLVASVRKVAYGDSVEAT